MIEKEHQKYKELFTREDSLERIREQSKKSKTTHDKYIANNPEKKLTDFLQQIKKGFSRFYIIINEENQDNVTYSIVTQKLNAIATIAIRHAGVNDVSNNLISKYSYIIELTSLHSYDGGKGSELVHYLKKLSARSNLPILLYDTNTKDENYFIDKGFVNSGEVGANNEPCLKYEPTK